MQFKLMACLHNATTPPSLGELPRETETPPRLSLQYSFLSKICSQSEDLEANPLRIEYPYCL
jgi:hypothetical protein